MSIPVSTEPSSTKARITAIVTTFNEERHIAGCLESLQWCDEILVVDSYSADRTPEISRSFDKVRFVQRTYYGSASQKNWAMDQANCEWILILDADERCTDALHQEIEALIGSEPQHDAYTINRRVFFLGRVIRFSGWQHDRVVRLLRPGAGRYPNRRVHADMVTRGPTPALKSKLDHHMVEDLVKYASRIQKYSWWGAAQAWREGRRSGVAEVWGRSAWRFFRTYLLQLGVFDGMRGLVFCMLQAYGTYLKWSYVWSWHVNQAAGIEPNLPVFDESEETWRGLEELISSRLVTSPDADYLAPDKSQAPSLADRGRQPADRLWPAAGRPIVAGSRPTDCGRQPADHPRLRTTRLSAFCGAAS